MLGLSIFILNNLCKYGPFIKMLGLSVFINRITCVSTAPHSVSEKYFNLDAGIRETPM